MAIKKKAVAKTEVLYICFADDNDWDTTPWCIEYTKKQAEAYDYYFSLTVPKFTGENKRKAIFLGKMEAVA